MLADWLERAAVETPVESLSDVEVLALGQVQLSPEQQAVMSELLERNREGALEAGGRRQLDELMRKYERGLLRKS